MNKEEKARVAAVKARITKETAFAVKVYRTIYQRQRDEEKFTGRHMGHDGRGFREFETVYLNAFYEELVAQGWKLTADQADEVRERMDPYAGQYIRASKEEAHAVASDTSSQKSKRAARAEAEKEGVGFSRAYDQAREEESRERSQSRTRKLTEKDKREIERALERMST